MVELTLTNKIHFFSFKIIVFIAVVLIYGITSSNSNLSGEGIFSITSILKYGSLFMLLLVCLIDFEREAHIRKKIKLKKEYTNFLMFFLIVLSITIFSIFQTGILSVRVAQNFIFTFTPMLIGYLLINTWTKNEIMFVMKVSFIIAYIEYLFSLKMSLIEIFKFFLEADYSNTNSSLLESNTFPFLALGFFAFFMYFKGNHLYKIASFIFVMMTYKRMVMLTAVLLLILSFFKLKEKSVPKIYVAFTIIILSCLGYAFFEAIQPANISQSSYDLGIDLRDFTTNRTDRLAWLETTNFQSYGFGSSTDFMYKNFNNFALEMDSVALIVELGIVSLIAFFTFYLRFAQKNMYVFVFMIGLLLNSVFSSGMSTTFGWLIILITMSSIIDSTKTESRRLEGNATISNNTGI